MAEVTRRNMLGWTALASVAGGAVALTANQAAAAAVKAATAPGPTTVSERARRRIQQQHLPNVPLVTHEGKPVRFYDDLVKGKIVTMNFFYTRCDEICPGVTANLAQVQKLLGADFGTKVQMYSLSLKPEEDDVPTIRKYREMFHAQEGWTFLTGKPEHMEEIRRGIGFKYPEPAIDKDKTQHIGNVRYGNEPLMLWAACPGLANAKYLAETISWMVRPETNRIQKS